MLSWAPITMGEHLMVNGLNLGLNPVWEINKVYEQSYMHFHGEVIKKNAENDGRINQLDTVTKLLMALNTDGKGKNGVDYTNDPEKRDLIDAVRDIHPNIVEGYSWDADALSNLRTNCNEEIRMITTQINPNLQIITQLIQDDNKRLEMLSEMIKEYRQGNASMIRNQNPR